MLQDLVRAYADAYTLALTSSSPRRREEEGESRELSVETPGKTQRQGWRGLLSVFL